MSVVKAGRTRVSTGDTDWHTAHVNGEVLHVSRKNIQVL